MRLLFVGEHLLLVAGEDGVRFTFHFEASAAGFHRDDLLVLSEFREAALQRFSPRRLTMRGQTWEVDASLRVVKRVESVLELVPPPKRPARR